MHPDQFNPQLLIASRIPGLPDTFYYIPDFITEDEEQRILQKLPPNRWTNLSHRRLQAHPSTLTPNSTLLAAPLPPYLEDPVTPRLLALGIFSGAGEQGFQTPHSRPNHVLVNEYRPGEGIMPHEDGDAYAPVVATVTLGSYGILDLWSKRTGMEAEAPGDIGNNNIDELNVGKEKMPVARILQEPRSLLVTTGKAYEAFLHGIDPRETDIGLVPLDVSLAAELEDARCSSTENACTNRPATTHVANAVLLAQPNLYIGDKEGKVGRGTRVSLTYRDVLKVSKIGGKLLGQRN